MSALGEFDREIRLSKIDRRSKGGRLISQIERELTAQLNRTPTTGERIMIQRAALIMLQLALMDKHLIHQQRLAGEEAKRYLDFSEELRRTLSALGMMSRAAALGRKRKPSFVEHLLDFEASQRKAAS